ncbi:hypothetical protein BURPS305_2609 [Burkholderia pseudomallei 305]|nr:hypothetical protein BURPS668_A3266 [Burkholderia pseudomallei 668]EBA47011.1 hypothetical protein BURPS305_2609 [Burkholderia pseudomallei 305]EEC32733.1 conserved hypothetical protein [Burkholderia pseudomallei 576]EEH24644.1 conserved hypothetical protein [Burkholderia pseudomallei Pakistan 9]
MRRPSGAVRPFGRRGDFSGCAAGGRSTAGVARRARCPENATAAVSDAKRPPCR